jgi:hypothetical protein
MFYLSEVTYPDRSQPELLKRLASVRNPLSEKAIRNINSATPVFLVYDKKSFAKFRVPHSATPDSCFAPKDSF